jgi:hypothetical protein
MFYITINTASEFACFLAALVFLYKDTNPAWRLLIPYLLLTCIVEIAAIYMRRVLEQPNFALYNVFILFECSVTTWLFYNLYKPYQHKKKWVICWLAAFVLMYVAELIYNHFGNFVTVTASVMSVVFVMASLYFYYLKLRDEQFERLIYSAPFWWVSGVLCFYFGSTACNLFFDYLIRYEFITYNRSIRYIIFNVLDIVMYLFWSLAFICRYRQRKLYHSLD